MREVFSRGGRKTFLSALLRFMCRRASAVHLRESRAWLKLVRVSWHGRWRMRARGAELSSLRALLAGPCVLRAPSSLSLCLGSGGGRQPRTDVRYCKVIR